MKISYLVTCSTETVTLQRLLDQLSAFVYDGDEVLIISDSDVKDRKETLDIIDNAVLKYGYRSLDHSLDRNYGGHKNWGANQCRNEWIFQLDGDECPTLTLLVNIKDIIMANPDVELFYVPRINDYKGVQEIHAKQWGWRLTPCAVCENRPIVNWPDYQGRIFKNEPTRIKWDRRLHEKIMGHTKYSFIPDDYDLALYHDKTIEKQLDTNKRYNIWFTEEENKGHGVI